ncbi:hypothetical protein [Aureispira anguillae]|uniref:Uncharacterized protein n=1 Tax=Aureispira anguillae TaxID=2864201 RepID=A0A915YB96_9BACT|nr:hypothetical protein [Aureispira anguillae]BDS09903.1 hypothetical protein AsAng_0006080 [Aureispira anguillae]
MIKFYQVLGLIIMVAMGSCIKDNNPSKPAYIYVENIFFESDTAQGQGSSSYDIVDAWISVDGQQLGANNLPTTFPAILDENFATNSVRISGGIKDNGITNTRAIYPFYEPYVANLVLESGKIDTFRPTLKYASNAHIILVEDFENPNQAIFNEDLDKNPNTKMIHQNTEVFEGNYSGLMVLDSANLDCTVATSTRYYNLSSVASSPVYIELNCKTTTYVEVGLIAHYGASNTEILYKGGVNPSDTWKKLYFNLTNEVYGTQATEYSVVFRALKHPSLDAAPKVYLDNIKLLHF